MRRSIFVVRWIVPTVMLLGIGAELRAQRQSGDLPETLLPLKVVDTSYINHSAKACGDFFEFANGAWLARDTIPAAYSSSGVARDMTDRNQLAVRSVLDDAMAKRKSLPATNTTRKLGTFYASCMDTATIDRLTLGYAMYDMPEQKQIVSRTGN